MQPVTTVAMAVALGSVPPCTWLPTHTQAAGIPAAKSATSSAPSVSLTMVAMNPFPPLPTVPPLDYRLRAFGRRPVAVLGAGFGAAYELDNRGRGLVRRAGVERRLGVVLDAELNRLRHLGAGDLGRQRQGHIDSRRDPGGRDDLAVDHHAFARRLGAVAGEPLEERPVTRRADTVEQPRGAEHQRAGADGGRPGGALVRGAHPVEHLFVCEQRPVALAARYQKDLGELRVRDRAVGAHAQGAGVGADEAGLLGDELHLGAG